MTRHRLPDQRPSRTVDHTHNFFHGGSQRLLVTVGSDAPGGPPREVFCASFKAGSDMNAAVQDACVLISRLLQMGVPPGELAASLSHPPSVVGTLVAVVAEEAQSE